DPMIANGAFIIGERERFPTSVLLLESGTPILAFEVARPGIAQISESPLNDTLGDLQRPGVVRFPQRLELLLQRVRTGLLLPFACLELGVLLVPCCQAPVVDKSAGACCSSQIAFLLRRWVQADLVGGDPGRCHRPTPPSLLFGGAASWTMCTYLV